MKNKFTQAAKNDDYEAVLKFISQNINVNCVDQKGASALHWAAIRGNNNTAEILVDDKVGADINLQDRYGQTPLHWAAGFRHISIIKLLLKKKAILNINIQDNFGQTALHWAAANGNKEILELLIDNGADIDIRDNQNKKPLDIATSNEIRDVLVARENLKNYQTSQPKMHLNQDNIDYQIAAQLQKELNSEKGKIINPDNQVYTLKNGRKDFDHVTININKETHLTVTTNSSSNFLSTIHSSERLKRLEGLKKRQESILDMLKDITSRVDHLAANNKILSSTPINNVQNIQALHLSNVIKEFKNGICKFPNYQWRNSEEFKHFKEFFYSFKILFYSLENNQLDEQIINKCIYHLELLWRELLNDYMNSYWFRDKNGSFDRLEIKYKSGPISVPKLKDLLELAILDNELDGYFASNPYVKDLLVIDRFIRNDTDSRKRNVTNFIELVEGYWKTLENYDELIPLLILREHIKFMLDRNDFDEIFYKNYFKWSNFCLNGKKSGYREKEIEYLSFFIRNDISYDLRKSPGYRILNWSSFDYLYKDTKNIPKQSFFTILQSLETFIDELILFKHKLIDEEQISSVDLENLHVFSTKTNLQTTFEIIENYLNIIKTISNDSSVSRLAILRTITAIGEGINVLNPLMPPHLKVSLSVILKLRDHIVHANTYESYNFLNDLIYNVENKDLLSIFEDIVALIQPLSLIKQILLNEKNNKDNYPKMPYLQKLNTFEKTFANSRNKDDRDEKLSIAERKQLLQSIPKSLRIINPYYNQIESFIKKGVHIDRESFLKYCLNTEAAKNEGGLREIYDKIKRLNSINTIREKLKNNSLDFTKLNLALNSADKKQLEAIKKDQNKDSLSMFLDNLENKTKLEESWVVNFLCSIKEVESQKYVKILRDFACDNGELPSKDSFNEAIKVLFIDNPEAKKHWESAYNKIVEGKRIYIKRYMIIQLNHVENNIQRLKTQFSNLYDVRGINLNSNPLTVLACEMLYGFCLEGFKNIYKNLNQLYDYDDLSLYFVIIRHPIDKVRKTLETYISLRNEIFHFERIFLIGENINFVREIWFSCIKNLTHGTFYSNSRQIFDPSTNTITQGNSKLEELLSFKELLLTDLDRHEERLNVHEAVKTKANKASALSNASNNKEDLDHPQLSQVNDNEKKSNKQGFAQRIEKDRENNNDRTH